MPDGPFSEERTTLRPTMAASCVHDRLCLALSEELIAGRSGGEAERGPALGSRSGLTRKYPQIDPLFSSKKSPKREPRAKPCIIWLPMLYYEGGSRKDEGLVREMETRQAIVLSVKE